MVLYLQKEKQDRLVLQNLPASIFPGVLICTSYISPTRFKSVQQEVLKLSFHHSTLHFFTPSSSMSDEETALASRYEAMIPGTSPAQGIHIEHRRHKHASHKPFLSRKLFAESSAGRGLGGAGVGTNRSLVVSERNAEFSLETHPTLLLMNASMAGREAVAPFPEASRDQW